MSILIRRQFLSRAYLISLAAALWVSNPAFAVPTESPELETLRIAKNLRPISDEAWKQIAGEQITGKYDISRGDTLYDISKRLFGDSRYWPKIWAMNNGAILNPHLIRPGNRIAFMPGTGSSLPSVSIESGDGNVVSKTPEHGATLTDADRNDPSIPKLPPRSQEWRMLPEQSWEATRIEAEQAAKKEIAVMGSLDKVHTLSPTRELSLFAASQPIPYLGEIVSSPSMTTYLKVGDQFLIHGLSDEMKPGETYAIVHEPLLIENNPKRRQGYGYHVDGEIQIIGVQSGLWIGVIKQGRGLIDRGSKLIAPLPRIKQVEPIPAPAVQEGLFYVDKTSTSFMAGQHGFGFVNLGSEDGLQEGMVFETFQTQDMSNGKRLDFPELFHVADMQVVQVSERYSTVQIIYGATEVYDGLPVRLVTDLSRLRKYGALPSNSNELPPPAPADSGNTPPAPEPEPSSTDSPVQTIDEEPPSPVAELSPSPAPSPAPTPSASPSSAPSAVPSPAPEATSSAVDEKQAPPPPPPAPAETPHPAPTHNELDALDGEDKLNPADERELKQLETYKATTPSEPASPTGIETAPAAPPAPAPADSSGVQEF